MRQFKFWCFILCAVCSFLSSSCSIRAKAFKAVADGMAPSYSKKEKEALRIERLKEKGVYVPNPMLAFLGEEDVGLVASSFPIIIKMYEMMMLQDRNHEGLARITGEFYIMYANAFVESPALFLSDNDYDKKNEAFLRARKLYLKGRDLLINSLEIKYKGIKAVLDGNDEKQIDKKLALCGLEDVEHLYWAGAASLAAFALEPLNTELESLVYAGHTMLERAGILSPSFNNGAIWEVLTKFYMAAPESLGGGSEKGEEAYKKAIQFQKEETPSLYITYATSFCIPKQDGRGFDVAIEKALSIDAKMNPENTLMFTISQNYARWLKAHKDDFILQ